MSDMTNEKMFSVLRKEGRQYRQKIKSLQELLDSQVKANCGKAAKLIDIEQSRNELLEFLKGIHGGNRPSLKTVLDIIQKAEAFDKRGRFPQKT